MRDRRSRLVLGLIAATLGVVDSARAQQIPVRVGGSTSSFVGVPFEAPIEIDMSARSEKLGSFVLTLRWNPLVLQLTGGTNGNFGAMRTYDDSIPYGLIKFVGANPAGVGGKVVIGVGHFVPIAAANDTFRLDVTELYAAGTFADLLPSATWSNRAYCQAVGRYGDIDGDQAANSRDALLALSYSVGTSVPGNPAMGDVDGDGATGARDALIILSNAVGLDVSGFRVLLVAPGACAAPRRPVLAVLPGGVTFDLGQHAQFTGVASDSTGAGIAVTDLFWKSSNDAVATVSPQGVVTAVAAGTATITLTRQGGTSASATVTVLQRRTHWVDAFASPDFENQLGAPELPFRTIPQGLAYARPGDTVRVRSGRYDETMLILKPVVLIGDTAGGKSRPRVATPRDLSAIFVNTFGRVEVQAFKFDTMQTAIEVQQADTMLVRWVEFRSAGTYYAVSLQVEDTPVLYVQRSDFFGSGANYYYYYNDAINVQGSAHLVSIDSTFIAEYGGDGVSLYGVDTLFVRGSRIRHNRGYGVSASSGPIAVAAVFQGNHFEQNYYGHVYLDGARSARFDHNRTVGGGYDGITVYGDTAVTDVTFRGDTLETLNYGSPIYLYRYDSLALDSAVIIGRDGYSYLSGGRFVSARDTKFLEISGDAMDIYAYPRDTTRLWLRNVEFRGPDGASCDRCGDMVYGNYLSVDADSVTMSNFYEGFYLDYSRVALRHATLNHYYYGVELDCGYVNAANSSFTSGEYGLEVYGCGAGDSVIVANSTFTDHANAAVYTYYTAATVVTSSQFTNNYYGIEHDCGQLRVTNVTATGGYYGVYGYGCSLTDTLRVDQSSLAQFYYGGYLSYATAKVTNSTFTDASYGLYLYNARGQVTDNQFIRPRYDGVYAYDYYNTGYSKQLLRNTVSCDALGATSASGLSIYRYYYASQDTLELAGNTVNGCNVGLETYGSYARVHIRGNTVAVPSGGENGIVADADTLYRVVGNTVTGPARYGSIWLYGVGIAEVDSNTVTGGIEAGIYQPYAIDWLRIRDNTISDIAPATCCLYVPTAGILLEASSSANREALLQRNRLARTTNGFLLERDYGDTVTVRIDSNTVKGVDSVGVWVRFYSRAKVRFNAIDSAGLDAVQLSDNYLALPAAVLDSNNLTHSRHFGVRNTSSYPVDATDNWWGDLSGPACATPCGSGDSVSAYVTFDPWLTTPASTLAPAPRWVATTQLAPVAAISAAAETAPALKWEPRPATAPRAAPARPVRTLRAFTIPAAAPAAESSGPAAQRLVAAARARADQLRQRQTERAQLMERQQAQRSAREQQRVQKQQERAAREAARQAPEAAPPRPQ